MNPEKFMKLEYQITKQDYIEFNLNFMRNSATIKRSLFIQRFLYPIIFLITPIFLSRVTDIPLWYWSCTFIIVFILWVAFYPRLLNKTLERKIAKLLKEGKAEGVLGNHEFSFTKEGMIDKTEFSETRYNFIEKIVETDEYIFIYVSVVMAYIIPKRAFKNVDEKSEFLGMFKRLYDETKAGKAFL